MEARNALGGLVLAAALAGPPSLPAQTGKPAGNRAASLPSPNACALLTDAEVERLVNRGRRAYGSVDTMVVAGGGTVCYYPAGAQIILFSGPAAKNNFESLLAQYQQDKAARRPVSGVGERAYIMFPPPRDKYEDRVALVVANTGQHTVGVSLAARDGAANSVSAQLCKSNQAQLSKKERAQCPAILADQGETAESLEPNVVDLAKVVVGRLQ